MCKQQFINIQTSGNLDLERVVTLPDNAMLKVKPELWVEWDFEKNDGLGLDIWKATKGQVKKTWWICSKCESNYDASIDKKTQGRGCSYCGGKKVNHTNSLESLKPNIAKLWNYDKNGSLKPNEVRFKSNKKVWWKCELGHEWEDVISDRVLAVNECPYCANERVLKGFNDLATTHPKIASLLLHKEDSYLYGKGSNKKVRCKCVDCGYVTEPKAIEVLVRNNGYNCPLCSDGLSFGEKFMFNLLKYKNIDFKSRIKFEWSNNKEYDFYIPSLNTIIEVHGIQHYNGGFSHLGGKTLEEEQINDMLKMNMAYDNGIKNYITLNFSKTNYKSVINEIEEHLDFLKINNIDIAPIYIKSSKSILLEATEMWNNGDSIASISEKIGVSSCTVSSYLKKSNQLGLCDYDSKTNKYRRGHGRIYVYKVSKESNNIIKYNSLLSASKEEKVSSSTIKRWCLDNKTVNGFVWTLNPNQYSL